MTVTHPLFCLLVKALLDTLPVSDCLRHPPSTPAVVPRSSHRQACLDTVKISDGFLSLDIQTRTLPPVGSRHPPHHHQKKRNMKRIKTEFCSYLGIVHLQYFLSPTSTQGFYLTCLLCLDSDLTCLLCLHSDKPFG